MDRVLRITPDKRVATDPTPGIAREQAFANGQLWTGVATTEPGVVSGWHHHGDNDTAVYVEAGTFRIEFGVDGADVEEGRPGDFLIIPKGVVHRESNPSDEQSRLILFRTGTGPPTINVDGPTE